jgi:BirA family transcriptional regulator, biotin operon repressor / biotin---[acetyl-CoA-carboxylase] ligase
VNAGAVRVLDALRRAGDRPCSGEALSQEYGISRAQVWKDVETLRARGYQIEAEPGGGYRLRGAPDRLYPEEIQHGLATRWLARDLHYFDETDSTNRIALDLARAGAAHGTAVVAESQTAGRGRLGRRFHSPPYQNLYTSIVLRPELSLPDAPAWTLAAAVAVADAVAEELGEPDASFASRAEVERRPESRVEIKWPNDVLVDGRKACGILLELAAEATRVAFLVLGIGVNLNVDPATFPEEFRASATSLCARAGRPIDRAAFARTLFTRLERVLDACAATGFHGILPRFEARFRMRGRRVRVRELGGREQEGWVRGIDDDGALRLALSGGAQVRFLAGDVSLAKEDA